MTQDRSSSKLPARHPSGTVSVPAESDFADRPLADSGRGNAARVARHRRRKAADGIRQVNLMVPEAAHRPLKELAKRLRRGEALEAAMFEVLSGLEQTSPARLLPPLKGGRSEGPSPTEDDVPLIDLSEDPGDSLPAADDDTPPRRRRFRLFG